MTTKDAQELIGDGPLAQVKRIWNKLDLVDRRLFIEHVLAAPLKRAMSEEGGDLDRALESLAVRG
jgi:hypothetical protein